MINMFTYVKEEQDVCMNILVNRKSILKDFLDSYSIDKPEKIVVFTTGSSLNAFLCSKLYMEKILNVEIEYKNPSEFVSYSNKCNDDNVYYFGISQTGRSSSTIDAVKKVNNFEKSFAVTCFDDSSLAKVCKHFIKIDCGEEKIGFVTKGMLSTSLTLMLLALELGLMNSNIDLETYNKELKKIEEAISNINEVINSSISWVENNKEELINAKRLILVSYGSCLGVASEGETKFTETIRVPASFFEMEDFLHGPCYELRDDSSIVIYLSSNNEILNNRIISIMHYLDKYAKKSYYFGYSEGNNHLILPKIDEYLSPILYLIPIQYIAYKITEYKGIDLNVKMFPDMDEKLGRKTL
ncbi:SIS domain-containing protein [Brachyspira pulli]|uniref:SIS domain-containing protein n=1 Tax=Brachyspira pulli TaxID=310721 RepID=UPI0030070D11